MHERNLKINIEKCFFSCSESQRLKVHYWNQVCRTSRFENQVKLSLSVVAGQPNLKDLILATKDSFHTHAPLRSWQKTHAAFLLKYDDKFPNITGDIRHHRDPCLGLVVTPMTHIDLFWVEYWSLP